jgi:hypothetical protein
MKVLLTPVGSRAQANVLEKWLERVAEEWDRLNVPNPVPVVDGLLVATAKVHGLTGDAKCRRSSPNGSIADESVRPSLTGISIQAHVDRVCAC